MAMNRPIQFDFENSVVKYTNLHLPLKYIILDVKQYSKTIFFRNTMYAKQYHHISKILCLILTNNETSNNIDLNP